MIFAIRIAQLCILACFLRRRNGGGGHSAHQHDFELIDRFLAEHNPAISGRYEYYIGRCKGCRELGMAVSPGNWYPLDYSEFTAADQIQLHRLFG